MPKQPATPAPNPATRVLSGPVHAVPCPHCGKPNDFRPLRDQMLLVEESQFDCDHCGHVMEFLNLRKVELINVRQSKRFQQKIKRTAPVQDARTVALSKVRR